MELYALNDVVRRRLRLLYILNIIDWVCTVILLSSGGFYEVNPLMRPIVTSVPLGCLIKGVLPAAIVAAIPRLTLKLDCAGITRIIRFTNIILTFYIALCFNHVFNFILLFLR